MTILQTLNRCKFSVNVCFASCIANWICEIPQPNDSRYARMKWSSQFWIEKLPRTDYQTRIKVILFLNNCYALFSSITSLLLCPYYQYLQICTYFRCYVTESRRYFKTAQVHTNKKPREKFNHLLILLALVHHNDSRLR